jgi:glycosyltransferase involved in cell wall biosynthesis
MNKKKLSFLFLFLRTGGLENLLILTFTKMVEKGYDVEIITLYVDDKIYPILGKNINYVKTPNKLFSNLMKNLLFRYLFGLPLYFYYIYKYLKNDYVVAFGNISFYFSAFLKIFRKKLKIIYYETDVKLPKKLFIPTKNFFQLIGQVCNLLFADFLDFFLIEKAQTLIVIDEKNMSYAIINYPKLSNKIVKIYPPVTSNFEKLNKKNVSKRIINFFSQKNTRFLSVIGTLDYKKNTIESIRFLKFLRDNQLNYKLVVVGDGELKENLIVVVKKLKLNNEVVFTGKTNLDELKYIYSKIYCNLFLAKHQTWGLTPFEALYFKKPSIVSAECGCSDYLKIKNIAKIVDLNDVCISGRHFLENEIPKRAFNLDGLVEMNPDYYINEFIKVINKN